VIRSSRSRRVSKLEGVNPETEVLLYFDDGSSRAFRFRMRSELVLFCEATHLANWILYPETPEEMKARRERKDVPPGAFKDEDPLTGRPISRFDKFFPLLMNAVRISRGGVFGMAWVTLVHVREAQRRGYPFSCTREALDSDPYYACSHKEDFTGFFGSFRGNLWKQLRGEPSSDSY
jgi:hypothetical protein